MAKPKKLRYYGGNGFESCREPGIYEVKFGRSERTFTDLKEAKDFYDSINKGKAFWDITGMPELIDCWE